MIDRAQIDASSARSLPELLRGRAGITLVNQGGLGKLSTLFLRGTESDHTLFLIDGVRVGSPTSGLTSLQDLPLAQIRAVFAEVYPLINAGQRITGDFAADAAREAGRA